MGLNDHIDEELHGRIRELLDLGYFEKNTMEHGIALLYADGGTLSDKQKYIFEKKIIPILKKPINDQEEFQQALQSDWENEARG